MPVYTHTGVGHTDNELAEHFDWEKLSQMFLELMTGFKPLVFGSRFRRSTNGATFTVKKSYRCVCVWGG